MSEFTKNQALFASIVGSKVAEAIPRFATIENAIGKQVLPAIPFLGRPRTADNDVDAVANDGDLSNQGFWKANAKNIDGQFFPLSIKRRDEAGAFYTLPYEPLINISASNKIVKRSVAKNVDIPGTVKERWSQDDYKISITGSLFGPSSIGSPEQCFPRDDFERLRDYCISPQGLEIRCEPLQLLGINYIVVEDFNFPFTKGENVQAYQMECLSDFTPEFLLELED